jgi:hypothetical protein
VKGDLVAVTEGVWAAEKHVTMPGGVHMPARMTVIRLADGRLVLHSPVALDDALAREIEALGSPAWIVLPNRMHHLFAPACAARFPSARVLAAPGLREKIPALRVDEVLAEGKPEAFGGEIEAVIIEGAPEMNEVVFLHRPSRTLVVSDLLFNITRPEGLATKVLLTLVGTRGKLAKSRLWWRFTKDRAAWDASVKKALAWDFDRVIMAHGDVVVEDGQKRAARALGF